MFADSEQAVYQPMRLEPLPLQRWSLPSRRTRVHWLVAILIAFVLTLTASPIWKPAALAATASTPTAKESERGLLSRIWPTKQQVPAASPTFATQPRPNQQATASTPSAVAQPQAASLSQPSIWQPAAGLGSPPASAGELVKPHTANPLDDITQRPTNLSPEIVQTSHTAAAAAIALDFYPAQGPAINELTARRAEQTTAYGSNASSPTTPNATIAGASATAQARSLVDQLIGRPARDTNSPAPAATGNLHLNSTAANAVAVPRATGTAQQHVSGWQTYPQQGRMPVPTLAGSPDEVGESTSTPAWRKQVTGLWHQVAGTNSRTVPPQLVAGQSSASLAVPAAVAQQQPAMPAFGHPPVHPLPAKTPNTLAGVTDSMRAASRDLLRPLGVPLDSTSGRVPPQTSAVAASTSEALPHIRSSEPASQDTLADSRLGSFLLQPFVLTNAESPADRTDSGRYRTSVSRADGDGDLVQSLRRSPLVQQLTFSNDGNLVTESADTVIATDAQLAAFLQEPTPEPNALKVEEADDLPLKPDDSAASDNDKENDQTADDETAAEDGEKKDDSLAGAEKLGEEPVDRSLDFLRTQTVLLKPGENQFDVGLTYLLTETEFPILLTDGMGDIVSVDEVSFRVRELTVPMEYRVGLLKRVQGFVGAPVGWSNTQVAIDSFDAFENDGGLGDVSFGLTAQLVDATANCPYVIGTLSATAPTGGDPFTNIAGLAPTAPSLGQGFWSISGNLVFIQQYDPVVIFYGLGTEQFFSRHLVGLDIEPGAQYNYQFGVGFAVNERITLSTRFFGAYVEEIKTNGNRRFGTNAEPMSIRLSATISQPCDRLVEPFVEFGITDDAVSSFFGISWTFSPKSHREAKTNPAAPAKQPTSKNKETPDNGKT